MHSRHCEEVQSLTKLATARVRPHRHLTRRAKQVQDVIIATGTSVQLSKTAGTMIRHPRATAKPLSLEMRGRRCESIACGASKDERPRCSRAVALRGPLKKRPPQCDGSTPTAAARIGNCSGSLRRPRFVSSPGGCLALHRRRNQVHRCSAGCPCRHGEPRICRSRKPCS